MAKRKGGRQGQTGGGEPLEQLRTFGDPVLRQETHAVTTFDARLRNLSEFMFEVMEREEGVGLAAPQIGLVSRIMVWMDPEDDYKRYVFVNPRIVSTSQSTTTEPEGCLSVPVGTVGVTRADEVVVEGQDLDGNPFRVELSGYQARVVQHEIDHLDGHLILDRASADDRKRVLKELRERALAGGS
jgi:peptide deformylase